MSGSAEQPEQERRSNLKLTETGANQLGGKEGGGWNNGAPLERFTVGLRPQVTEREVPAQSEDHRSEEDSSKKIIGGEKRKFLMAELAAAPPAGQRSGLRASTRFNPIGLFHCDVAAAAAFTWRQKDWNREIQQGKKAAAG